MKSILFFILKLILKNNTFLWDFSYLIKEENEEYEFKYIVFAKSFEEAKKKVEEFYGSEEDTFISGGGVLLDSTPMGNVISVTKID